ncbi:MAG: hypothetical protein JXA94_02870 [Parachlamydiales bacterium]|nr:hypothetical protein [Parachlamydiales bacterium]
MKQKEKKTYWSSFLSNAWNPIPKMLTVS